jgi:prolyl 4-hydroxylase
MPALNAPNPQAVADYIQVFDDALPATFCQQMLHSFDALTRFHQPNGRGIRAGHESSAWTELDITPLTDANFRQILLANMHKHLARYNRAIAQLASVPTLAIPGTEKISELIIKRYRPDADEAFQLHFDAIGSVSNRYLVFLWYLNDVTEGGETEFPALGVSVKPKTGRLVMFPPYWMFQHQGKAPLSGDKYILSSYFLF